jgi:pimeloyl-ACP methyl ester carboxylesterase
MRRLAVFLAFYLALSLAAGIFLCEAILHPAHRPLTNEDESRAQSLAAQYNASLHDISITTADHIPLKAWLLVPAESNRHAVILLHGLADNRTGMFGYAELLLAQHFAVLLPDARAHGASGGAIATYGLLERNDIRQWFDWLASNRHPDCIDGFGESMGAAQLLQSLAVEPGFCAVAAESAFSNFHEIAYDRAGQYFQTGPWLGRSFLLPALAFAFLYAKEKYGLDLDAVSPEAAIAASRTPVFLIHGHDDSNIPLRHSERIAARNPRVVLWTVPNADHCGAISTAPAEFESRLLGWYRRN